MPVAWNVDLTTCVDANADVACVVGVDSNVRTFGATTLNVAAGSSSTVSWSVSLNEAPSAHVYVFTPTCRSPCTGQAPVATDRKSGVFQLAFTNTWTRTLTTPIAIANSTASAVTYRVASTSLDDQDLAGTATLYSTPKGSAERTEGPLTINAAAGQQQTLTWPSVLFSPWGRQQERVNDSTASIETFANSSVLDAVLNVTIPRATYTAGDAFGTYVTLLGRGGSTDPQPLAATNVTLVLRNDTFVVTNLTLKTDANGTAYVVIPSAADATNLSWVANTSVSWNGFLFAPNASGRLTFTQSPGVDLAAVTENVTSIRSDVANMSLHGVQLDETGTHNLVIELGRVTLYASLIAGLLIALVLVSFRV